MGNQLTIDKVERLVAKFTVDQSTGCWEWTAAKNQKGYGYWKTDMHGRGAVAHRWVYELIHGDISDGKVLDHLCRNTGCVNPKHLEPVTNRENLLRGDTLASSNLAKTHCPQGHPLSGDNLYTRPDRSERGCKVCRREAVRRYLG